MDLISVAAVKRRTREGLKSKDMGVRGWTNGELAALDPYDPESRDAIDAKIRRGIEQLDRGEGISEDQLDAYLAKLKAKAE